MQRIPRIDEPTAPAEAASLLAQVRRQMGSVPNILATMAQSPATLAGYLGFAGGLAGGALPPALREQIAVSVAGASRCDYCASAHTAIGARQGVGAEELTRNLSGLSDDPKTQAALDFALRIVVARGSVTDDDLAKVRRAGFSDGQVVEIVAHTALNLFTNYFNHIAATDIDFAVVETAAQAA